MSSTDSNSSIDHEMPTGWYNLIICHFLVDKSISCSIASTQENSRNIASIPKLHELDRIEGNNIVVKVIEHVASTWDKLALRLHFSHQDISRIHRDTREQSMQAVSTMFTDWLDGKGRKPMTWETLITALKEGEYLTIASELEVIFRVHDHNDIIIGSESDIHRVSVPQPRNRSFKCTVL